MASINGVSSSNSLSSLMNSANMISGLASGLDTESMIEGLVKSYQTKISQLNQKVTKTEWKQDAYRRIIQQMVGFSNKYTSYMSSTNLSSPSFFNNARVVEPKGKYADKVTASGRTDNDVVLNSVSQLATAAGINGRVLQTYEQGGRDLSGAKLATLLKICLALNCKLEDILPDGETTELLRRYTMEQAG